MACERYKDTLTDAAAGAPSPAGLEAHLAECDACRHELAELRRALALVDTDLRELLAAEPSPELAARIRLAAAEPEAAPVWRPRLLWPVLAAAALLAALVGVRVLRPAPEPAGTVAVSEPLASPAPPVPKPTAAPSLTVPKPRVAMAAAPRPALQPATASKPEVLVPSGGIEALVRLVAVVQQTQLKPAVFAATGQPSPDLAELRSVDIEPIDVKPLEIVPLDPAETLGTKAEGDRR